MQRMLSTNDKGLLTLIQHFSILPLDRASSSEFSTIGQQISYRQKMGRFEPIKLWWVEEAMRGTPTETVSFFEGSLKVLSVTKVQEGLVAGRLAGALVVAR